MRFDVMDHTGHTELTFGPAERAKAAETFNRLIAEGKLAAVRGPKGTLQQVRKFPEEAQEIVFSPQLIGG